MPNAIYHLLASALSRATPAATILFASLAVPAPGHAQTPGNVVLDAHEQLFSVLAARMAAGSDPGAYAETGGEFRSQLRAALGRKKIPALPELQRFFQAHRPAEDPAAELGQYISLALLVGPPPDFRFTVPQSDLPPDAKALADLIPLLKDFYEQAGMLEIWVQFKARHDAEIARYSDPVRRSIAVSDAYFGFPSGAYLGRTYTIWLSLLGAPEQVHARIYGQNYYLVVTPSREPKLAEIRHQYLHFLLDPLAVKFALEINQKSELKMLVRAAPQLGLDFKEDFPLFVTECLIRAAELRMDKRPAAEAEKSLEELTASGLVLAPYFHRALADFEKQEASLNQVYRQMIEGIDVAKEAERLAAVQFAPQVPATTAQVAPAASEEERLLNQADNLIAEGRYNEAKALFQEVLERLHPHSERALFGLAVIASNTRKPGLAEEYFRKTLEVARDLRLVSWSHIYLGRLYDLNGDRNKALAEYRAASLTATTYPDALRAVQSGLQKAYGSRE